MSADWFFMKKGFLGSKKIGPIAESDFLHRIEKGEISPETMVSSTSKTHGHWLHLREIRAGVQFWNKTHPNAIVPSSPADPRNPGAPPRSQ